MIISKIDLRGNKMLIKHCKIVFAVLFACLIACSVVYAEEDALRDSKVVVEVNGAAITQGELDMAVAKLLPRAVYHREVSPEKQKEIEKRAIEDMINELLFFQEATTQGLEAERSEIKVRFSSIERQYPSKKAFKEAMKKYGVTKEDIENRIKKDILIEKLINKETKISLTDKEVEDYYNKNTEKFREPESISIRYISIKFNMSERDFRKKAQARAKEVLSKLKAGEDFAKLAWAYSDDQSKVKGGEVGFIHRDRFDPEIENAAFSLRIGQVSNIIANEYGYHIIKAEGKKSSKLVSFSEIKEKLKGELISSYQTKKKEAIINRLRSNAEIKYY